MATVLRFPDRIPKRPSVDVSDNQAPAAVLILPCVRRESIGAATLEAAAQRQA